MLTAAAGQGRGPGRRPAEESGTGHPSARLHLQRRHQVGLSSPPSFVPCCSFRRLVLLPGGRGVPRLVGRDPPAGVTTPDRDSLFVSVRYSSSMGFPQLGGRDPHLGVTTPNEFIVRFGWLFIVQGFSPTDGSRPSHWGRDPRTSRKPRVEEKKERKKRPDRRGRTKESEEEKRVHHLIANTFNRFHWPFHGDWCIRRRFWSEQQPEGERERERERN